MRTVPPTASLQLGAFTIEQAIAAGWTAHALRHAVRSGRLDRLWRGVYATRVDNNAPGRSTRLAQCAVGAAVANHGLYVSHLAAASMWGWPAWAPKPHPCVSHSGSALTRVDRVHVHRCDLEPGDRSRVGEVHVTSASRTVVDVAREFGVEAGLVVADAALRSGRMSWAALEQAMDRATGLPGVVGSRELLLLADGKAESALESRSRYRMARAGIPAPATQVKIYDEFGDFLGRVDHYWHEFGVVGEADGKTKFRTDPDVGWKMSRRESRLRRTGLGYECWGWADLTPFDPTARKLWSAFEHGEKVLRRRRWRAVLADVGVRAADRANSPL